MLFEGEKFEETPTPEEREEIEEKIEEKVEEKPEEVELKKETELSKETKDEIERFIKTGFEKAKKRVEEYEKEQERQRELPYEKRRHIDVDEAVYERTAVYTPYAKFLDALEGFEKGNYSPVIEVLEKFKTEEEERLESYRGALNSERLGKILSGEWDKLPEEKREEINKKIEDIDAKIKFLKQKRMNWVEQLRNFLK
jgi:hypothetical protein